MTRKIHVFSQHLFTTTDFGHPLADRERLTPDTAVLNKVSVLMRISAFGIKNTEMSFERQLMASHKLIKFIQPKEDVKNVENIQKDIET